MAHHAFVAMPFGIKEDIDFNAVFRELIKPALEGAGFEVFRADEEMRAAFEVMSELRGHLDQDTYMERLAAMRPLSFQPCGTNAAGMPLL